MTKERVTTEEEEKSKKLAEILERMVTEETTVYHWRNGEIIAHHELYPLVKEAIKERQPDLAFVALEKEFGYERVYIYLIPNFAIVEKVWIPFEGYAWDEKKVEIWRLLGEKI